MQRLPTSKCYCVANSIITTQQSARHTTNLSGGVDFNEAINVNQPDHQFQSNSLSFEQVSMLAAAGLPHVLTSKQPTQWGVIHYFLEIKLFYFRKKKSAQICSSVLNQLMCIFYHNSSISRWQVINQLSRKVL